VNGALDHQSSFSLVEDRRAFSEAVSYLRDDHHPLGVSLEACREHNPYHESRVLKTTHHDLQNVDCSRVTMAPQERLYTHTSHIHQHSSLFHFECGIFALSFRCLNWSANADKSQKNLSFECNNSLLCTHFFGTSKLITSLTFRICFAQLSPDDNTMITRRPLLVYKLFLPMNTVTYYKLGNRNVSIKILFLFGC